MGVQEILTHYIDESIYYLDVVLWKTKKEFNPLTNTYD